MTAWILIAVAALAADVPATSSDAVPEAPVAVPDRSSPPPVHPPEPLDLSEPEVWEVRPGVTAQVVTVPGVRKVHGVVYLHRGSLDLDGRPTPAAGLTGWLQDVATATHSSADLEILQDLADISVSSSAVGQTRTSVSLEVPRERLAEGLGLLFEVLEEPAYPGKELRQTRDLRRFWYTVEAPSSPQAVASDLMDHAWYPADTSWGTRPDLEALDAVRPKHLRARHERLLAEAPVTVLLVGDLTRGDVEGPLAAALADVGAPGDETPAPVFEATPGLRVVAADMPGQEQAVIMARTDAPPRDHADRLAFEIVNWALGGHFMSRLNANLREEKGFTYGAGSGYRIRKGHGAWTAYVTVKSENAGATITEIRAEVAAMREEGLTPDEIDAAWKEWVGDWNTVRQTGGTAFDFYESLFLGESSVDGTRRELDAIAAQAPEASAEVASRWLDPESAWVWVVVGDRETLAPQLDALGLDVTWVTPRDAILGTF